MGNKKELRKITQQEKAVANARGEALFAMGIVVVGLSLLLAIVEIASGTPKKSFGYVTIAMGYVAAFSIYSYKYQKTKGFMVASVVGAIIALGCFVLYILP